MSAGVSPRGASLQPTVIPESPLLGPLSVSKTADSSIPPASLSQSQERSKFTPPIPGLASSITPPPSSQVVQIYKHVVRTPSPPASQLTSPPPTNRAPVLSTSNAVQVNDLPTTEQVDNASMDELREMVDHLNLAVREARTAAAHYKLQHNMLLIDSSEASKRMEVELQLTQREVEVLQEAEERRRAEYISPSQQAGNAALINDLNRHCLSLQNENEELRDMLARATRDVEDRDGQLLSLREENQRLRHRIRMNREHMNGFLDSVSEGSPRSLMGTPHRTPHHNTTPRHAPTSRGPVMPSQGREPGAFEALLLADKVLNSQETATAPSTPRASPLRHRMGHTRNTHSLSSLPTTPSRRPLHPSASSQLRTPPHLTTILEPPSVGQPFPPHFGAISVGANPGLGINPGPGPVVALQQQQQQQQRRRASSDSTITASSIEDQHAQLSATDDEDDEIPESQASQVATSMLKRTPGSSQQSLGTKNRGTKLTQARIMGKVVKSHSAGVSMVAAVEGEREKEKRRLTSFGAPGEQQGSPSKKNRVGTGTTAAGGSGPVGLGIGIGVPGRGE